MCQPHESHGEARAREFWASHGYSVRWCASIADTEGTCDSADNGIDGQQALIDADIRAFRERLRSAVRRLTIAEFAELRRQYESVWFEILAEL